MEKQLTIKKKKKTFIAVQDEIKNFGRNINLVKK